MIRAHGAVYATTAEAEARIAELNETNLRVGASDGRVTEIGALLDALQAEEVSARKVAHEARIAAERAARSAAPVTGHALGGRTLEQVREAEARIRRIQANRSLDDGQWRYLRYQDDAGRNTRREYRTELGFLRAYVRRKPGPAWTS